MANYKYYRQDIINFLIALVQSLGRMPNSKDIERACSRNDGATPRYETVRRGLGLDGKNISSIHSLIRLELKKKGLPSPQPEQASLFQ